MMVIIGLLVLIAAAAVAVVGVATNTGSAHPLGGDFAIFGQHLSGLSTGQLFLCGIVVGVVGMLGLSLLLGPFTRRLASRGSRRELKGSRRETIDVRQDRDRLTQQLDAERTERIRADASAAGGSAGTVDTAQTGQTLPPDQSAAPVDQSAAPEPALANGSGTRHRNAHHRGR
jgi:hypothetical protein